MRGNWKWALLAALGGVALALSSVASNGSGARVQAQEGATALGIDVNPEGNTATSVSVLDKCIAVKSGDTFDIDVTVESVSSLIGWEAYVGFDQNVVHVADRDVNQFLASIPEANLQNLSESVPDDDGRFRVGATDISDPQVGIDGSGVLARLTLQAQQAGLTTLTVSPIPTDVNVPVGPLLRHVDGSNIGDLDADGLFDGPYLSAQVAVDEPCPGEGGVVLTDIAGGDDGIATWILIALAIGIIAAAAGLGGVALIVLRRSGSGSHPAT